MHHQHPDTITAPAPTTDGPASGADLAAFARTGTRDDSALGSRAVRAAIAALATVAFALSYDALRQMALAAHIRSGLTYLFPLVIDGFIALGVIALILLRDAPLRSRLYVWALVATATLTSIWANALHAVRLNEGTRLHLDNATVGALSAIAPLALAGAVHLHLVINRHRLSSRNAGRDPSHAAARTATATPGLPSESPRPVGGEATEVPARPLDKTPPPPTTATSSEEDAVREPCTPPTHGFAAAAGTETRAQDARPDADDETAPADHEPAETAPEAPRSSAASSRRATVPEAELMATARALAAETGRVPRAALEKAVRAKGWTIRKDLAQQAATAVMAERETATTATETA